MQAKITRLADGYCFVWPDSPLTIKLTRIRESSRGTTAELQAIHTNGTGQSHTLAQQSVNLLTSKSRLCQDLVKRFEADWTSLIEQACIYTLRELRQGEPIESMHPTDEDHAAWFVLNPLLYANNPTVLYGPGDSMKSFFALYCGLLFASGVQGPNLACSPERRRVLFLDWEMSLSDLRGRVKLLQAGDERLTQYPDYRRCSRPLADEIEEVKKAVREGGYDLVILDSLAMAAGGQELERADAAIRFHAALRALHTTSLILGHTPKPQEDQKERSLYGSVFFHNLCRVSWEVRRENQTICLYQKKNNLGPQQEALAFRLAITDQSATIESADPFEEPTLAHGLKLQDQIAQALTTEPGLTIKEIADRLGQKSASVKAKLYAFKKRFIAVDGKWECLA